MAQPESKLSRAIMAALRNRGCYAVKIHGGQFTAAGTPDILACVPVLLDVAVPDGIGLVAEEQWIGKFVAFETKTPEGGNPEPIQERVHEKIVAAWGVVFVPRSVEDAVRAIRQVGWTHAPPTAINPSAAI